MQTGFPICQAGSPSGVLRVGQSPSALLTLPEPELGNKQDIAVIQPELDSVVGWERGKIEQSSIP